MPSYSRRPCGMVSLRFALCCSLMMIQFAAASPQVSLPGCPSRCGNLTIPYPFGIGIHCARTGFDLSCNDSFSPEKTFLDTGNVEVRSISLVEGQAKVGLPRAYDCYNSTGSFYSTIRAGGTADSPYTFSSLHNKFTVIGCDTYAYIKGWKSRAFSGGCMSLCYRDDITNGSCSGLGGCCQIAIPTGLKHFEVEVRSFYNHTNVIDFNPCGYAFLVDQDEFTFRSEDITANSVYGTTVKQMPVVLDWVVGNETCEVAKDLPTYACRSVNSECKNSTSSATGYLCNCSSGYEGNPYLHGGCQDIDECERREEYPCQGHCTNLLGSYRCECPKGTYGNATISVCRHENMPVKVILATVFPALFVTVFSILSYGFVEKRKRNKLVQKLYQQNGGPVLEDHLSTHGDIQSRFKIFTKEELEKATNKFDDQLVLGRGGQGKVYKGTLSDGSDIAIKKSVQINNTGNDGFINEIIILTKINHPNVVKLIGCCLEVEIPYLVYELMPNKTLYDHIRGRWLSWEKRLRIAAGAAGALAHLHTISIYHQDVKSTNILLTMDYTAKMSDFGLSRLAPSDPKALSTLVQGTIGYLDPEFIVSHRLTGKSDVFSFGVVLAELLTGKPPLCYERNVGDGSLAQQFKLSMEENNVFDILDQHIVDVATEVVRVQIMEVAKLADRCLNIKGKDRPDMMEVFLELEGLWRSGYHRSVEDQSIEETQRLIAKQGLESLNGESEECRMLFHSTGTHISAFDIEAGR